MRRVSARRRETLGGRWRSCPCPRCSGTPCSSSAADRRRHGQVEPVALDRLLEEPRVLGPPGRGAGWLQGCARSWRTLAAQVGEVPSGPPSTASRAGRDSGPRRFPPPAQSASAAPPPPPGSEASDGIQLQGACLFLASPSGHRLLRTGRKMGSSGSRRCVRPRRREPRARPARPAAPSEHRGVHERQAALVRRAERTPRCRRGSRCSICSQTASPGAASSAPVPAPFIAPSTASGARQHRRRRAAPGRPEPGCRPRRTPSSSSGALSLSRFPAATSKPARRGCAPWRGPSRLRRRGPPRARPAR